MCRYAINRIGFGYDTKNILDLMRFLIPLPIPQRWRRQDDRAGLRRSDQDHLLGADRAGFRGGALSDPAEDHSGRQPQGRAREILHIRDSSLYMPRDFDISPYFAIVKPTIDEGFDYTALHWADKPKPLAEVAGTFDPFPGIVRSAAAGS